MLRDSVSQRAFANTATCRKAVLTTRILQLVHELCTKRIHVTKRGTWRRPALFLLRVYCLHVLLFCTFVDVLLQLVRALFYD